MSGQVHHPTSQAHDEADDQEKTPTQLFLWMASQTKKRLYGTSTDVSDVLLCHQPVLTSQSRSTIIELHVEEDTHE